MLLQRENFVVKCKQNNRWLFWNIANVQNICNFIGPEQYIIDCIVLFVSILHSLVKNLTKNIWLPWREKILIKKKLIINTWLKNIYVHDQLMIIW